MLTAAFLGTPHFLKLAYPETLRSELRHNIRLLSPDIKGSDWAQNTTLLSQADVILGTWGLPPMDDTFLKAAPRLRAVFYAAGAIKNFALPAAYQRGISFSSAWSANAIPVAEYTLSTILLSLKHFWTLSRKTHQLRTFDHSPNVPGAYHSKVGLVSLGAVGRLVAKRLSAFDLDLSAFDPYADPQFATHLGISMLTLPHLFASSDVVSLHAPWLPETENLITGDLIRSMKPGATLINTSRGAIIDQPALCQALSDRPDLTAILDVTHPEPPPADCPLFDLPNAILTPHIAGSMGTEVTRMGQWMADELTRYLEGEPLLHSISQDMLARMA